MGHVWWPNSPIHMPITGWWFGCHLDDFPINIGVMSSSQLTNSYFSEGWPWPTKQLWYSIHSHYIPIFAGYIPFNPHEIPSNLDPRKNPVISRWFPMKSSEFPLIFPSSNLIHSQVPISMNLCSSSSFVMTSQSLHDLLMRFTGKPAFATVATPRHFSAKPVTSEVKAGPWSLVKASIREPGPVLLLKSWGYPK